MKILLDGFGFLDQSLLVSRELALRPTNQKMSDQDQYIQECQDELDQIENDIANGDVEESEVYDRMCDLQNILDN